MRHQNTPKTLATAGALLTLLATAGYSANHAWQGLAADNNWTSPANWDTLPANNGDVVFAGTIRQNANNDNGPLAFVGNLTLANGGFNITGSNLSISNSLNNTGDNTWGIATTIVTPQTWTSTAGTLTVTKTITSPNTLLTIAGTGNTILNGIYGNGIYATSAGIVKKGSGTLTLNQPNRYIGQTSVEDGTLVYGVNGSIPTNNEVVLGNASTNTSGTIKLIGGTLALGKVSIAGTGTQNRIINGGSAFAFVVLTVTGSQNMPPVIGGTTALENTIKFVKDGTGTLNLTGTNRHIGSNYISRGQVNFDDNANFGGGIANTIFGGTSFAGAINFTGQTGEYTRGGLLNTTGGSISATTGSSLLIHTGGFSGNGPLTFGGEGNITVTSEIRHNNNLSKTGTGTLTLTGELRHTGNTQVQAGTLILSNTSTLYLNLTDTTSNIISGVGAVQLNGTVEIDSAVVNQTSKSWTLITATNTTFGSGFNLAGFTKISNQWVKTQGSQTLTFDPATKILTLTTADAGTGTVSAYETWAQNQISTIEPGADTTAGGDPDTDGKTNLLEYALAGNPLQSEKDSLTLAQTTLGGEQAHVLTLPVRNKAVFTYPEAAATIDGITYQIQGSTNLAAWNLPITEVTGPGITTLQGDLPLLENGWNYRTFRAAPTVPPSAQTFLRVKVQNMD
jgi:autotransporter-associated beta strand protein